MPGRVLASVVTSDEDVEAVSEARLEEDIPGVPVLATVLLVSPKACVMIALFVSS